MKDEEGVGGQGLGVRELFNFGLRTRDSKL